MNNENEFCHDLLFNEYKQIAFCKTCEKEFSLIDHVNFSLMKKDYCSVKVNKRLKENMEKEMITMLGKYFCIWKV